MRCLWPGGNLRVFMRTTVRNAPAVHRRSMKSTRGVDENRNPLKGERTEMRRNMEMGSRWFNRLTLTLLAGAGIGTIGLRSFAQPPVGTADALTVTQTAPQDAATDFIGDELSTVVATPPGPIIRTGTACCIPSEDRCVNPMTLSECTAARGSLVLNCRFCVVRIDAGDDFESGDEVDTIEVPAPVLNPTTVVYLVASFMLP